MSEARGPVVTDKPVRARVVRADERRSLAWAVALGGGLGVAYMLAFHSPHSFALARHVCATLMLLWLAGPWLLFRQRERVLDGLACPEGLELAGVDFVPRGTAVSVARAARGYSLAVAAPRGLVFLEVEHLADARRLVRALGAPWPGQGVLERRVPRLDLRFASGSASGVGIASALGYLLTLDTPGHEKGLLAIALFMAILASLGFVLDPRMRRRVRWSAEADGVEGAEGVTFGRSPVEQHTALHVASRLGAVADEDEPPRARVRVLSRGEETTREWLTRLDAIATRSDGAYREGAPDRDELELLLADESGPADARLAAARVLARRHGEDASRLRARFEPDLAARLDAVLHDDPSSAAEELDARGPDFAAR